MTALAIVLVIYFVLQALIAVANVGKNGVTNASAVIQCIIAAGFCVWIILAHL